MYLFYDEKGSGKKHVELFLFCFITNFDTCKYATIVGGHRGLFGLTFILFSTL